MNKELSDKWQDDDMCFACGKENAEGLKLAFEIEDGRIRTEFTFGKKFQGYTDIVHGGIIGLVLDEVMVNLPWKIYKVPVVSAEMNVRLIKPARVGRKIIFTAWFANENHHRKLVDTASEARLEDGTLIARATAKCVKV